MERMPQSGEIYQHFKGSLYRIVTMAEHTETGETLVVYQALYGEMQVYARPLAMFLSEVDHEKYPQVTAKDRFTLVPLAGSVMTAAPTVQPVGTVATAEAVETNVTEMHAESGISAIRRSEAEMTAADAAEGRMMSVGQEPQEEEFALDPGLLQFLEADSYEEKLEVFASLAGIADEEMLNTMAVSLDLELSEGSLEEKYDTLKNCLLTLEKYECNRLR